MAVASSPCASLSHSLYLRFIWCVQSLLCLAASRLLTSHIFGLQCLMNKFSVFRMCQPTSNITTSESIALLRAFQVIDLTITKTGAAAFSSSSSFLLFSSFLLGYCYCCFRFCFIVICGALLFDYWWSCVRVLFVLVFSFSFFFVQVCLYLSIPLSESESESVCVCFVLPFTLFYFL